MLLSPLLVASGVPWPLAAFPCVVVTLSSSVWAQIACFFKDTSHPGPGPAHDLVLTGSFAKTLFLNKVLLRDTRG